MEKEINIDELIGWDDSLQEQFIHYRKRRRMARIEKIFNNRDIKYWIIDEKK